MKLLTFILLLMINISLISCGNQPTAATDKDSLSSSNPFYTESTLPFQAPDFSRIKNSDFKPALEAGMKQKLSGIQLIEDNPDSPSFNNTVRAMEKAGALLDRTSLVFNALTGANTNPELQALQEAVAPRLAATEDAIYLNSKLFKRVDTLYKQRERLNLDSESLRLLEYYEQQFEMAGAKLTNSGKEELKKLNQEEASLKAQFTNRLLAATRAGALVISDSAALAGLPSGTVESAAQKAKADQLSGKWVISLQNTTQQPDLQFLSDRNTRRKLFDASWNRAEKKDTNDTRDLIIKLARLRAQKAKLLGFPNYAGWSLQNQMAKTPEAVNQFLNKLIPAATARAREEAAAIQALIDKQKGGFSLQPWDWNFYADQVRKAIWKTWPGLQEKVTAVVQS